eukprot:536370_1
MDKKQMSGASLRWMDQFLQSTEKKRRQSNSSRAQSLPKKRRLFTDNKENNGLSFARSADRGKSVGSNSRRKKRPSLGSRSPNIEHQPSQSSTMSTKPGPSSSVIVPHRKKRSGFKLRSTKPLSSAAHRRLKLKSRSIAPHAGPIIYSKKPPKSSRIEQVQPKTNNKSVPSSKPDQRTNESQSSHDAVLTPVSRDRAIPVALSSGGSGVDTRAPVSNHAVSLPSPVPTPMRVFSAAPTPQSSSKQIQKCKDSRQRVLEQKREKARAARRDQKNRKERIVREGRAKQKQLKLEQRVRVKAGDNWRAVLKNEQTAQRKKKKHENVVREKELLEEKKARENAEAKRLEQVRKRKREELARQEKLRQQAASERPRASSLGDSESMHSGLSGAHHTRAPSLSGGPTTPASRKRPLDVEGSVPRSKRKKRRVSGPLPTSIFRDSISNDTKLPESYEPPARLVPSPPEPKAKGKRGRKQGRSHRSKKRLSMSKPKEMKCHEIQSAFKLRSRSTGAIGDGDTNASTLSPRSSSSAPLFRQSFRPVPRSSTILASIKPQRTFLEDINRLCQQPSDSAIAHSVEEFSVHSTLFSCPSTDINASSSSSGPHISSRSSHVSTTESTSSSTVPAVPAPSLLSPQPLPDDPADEKKSPPERPATPGSNVRRSKRRRRSTQQLTFHDFDKIVFESPTEGKPFELKEPPGECTKLIEVVGSLSTESSIAVVALGCLTQMPENFFNRKMSQCFAFLAKAEAQLKETEEKRLDKLGSTGGKRIRFNTCNLSTIDPPAYCRIGSQRALEAFAQHVFAAQKASKFLAAKNSAVMKHVNAMIDRLAKTKYATKDLQQAAQFIINEFERFIRGHISLPLRLMDLCSNLLSSLLRFYLKYSEIGTEQTVVVTPAPSPGGEEPATITELVPYHGAEIFLKLREIFSWRARRNNAAIAKGRRTSRPSDGAEPEEPECVLFFRELANITSKSCPMFLGHFDPNHKLTVFEEFLRKSWAKLRKYASLVETLGCEDLDFLGVLKDFRSFVKSFE